LNHVALVAGFAKQLELSGGRCSPGKEREVTVSITTGDEEFGVSFALLPCVSISPDALTLDETHRGHLAMPKCSR